MVLNHLGSLAVSCNKWLCSSSGCSRSTTTCLRNCSLPRGLRLPWGHAPFYGGCQQLWLASSCSSSLLFTYNISSSRSITIIIINLSNLANEWLEGNCFASANNRSTHHRFLLLLRLAAATENQCCQLWLLLIKFWISKQYRIQIIQLVCTY